VCENIEEICIEPDAHVDAEEKSAETRVLYEMKKLHEWFHPEASTIDKILKSGLEMILNQANISVMILKILLEPGIFDGAFNHSDLDSRTKWRSAIDKEFKEMNVRGV
jgi:hypothetical protein